MAETTSPERPMRARRLPTSTRHGCHEGSGRCVRIPVIAHLSITTGAYPHASNVAMKCVVRPGARPRRADFVPFGSEGMRLERSVAAGHGGRTVSIAAAAIRFMPEQQRHTMHPDYTVLRGQDQRADCVLKLRDTAPLLRFDRRKHPKNGSFKEFEERGVLSGVHFIASGTAAAWNHAQPTMR